MSDKPMIPLHGGANAWLGYSANNSGMLAAVTIVSDIQVQVFTSHTQTGQLQLVFEHTPEVPVRHILMHHTSMKKGGVLNHFNLLERQE